MARRAPGSHIVRLIATEAAAAPASPAATPIANVPILMINTNLSTTSISETQKTSPALSVSRGKKEDGWHNVYKMRTELKIERELPRILLILTEKKFVILFTNGDSAFIIDKKKTQDTFKPVQRGREG